MCQGQEMIKDLIVKLMEQANSVADHSAAVILATSAAVQGDERWTPFAYDPRREDSGGSAFVPEGAQVRKEIQAFLSRESLLTMVARRSLAGPEDAPEAGIDLSQGIGDASILLTGRLIES